jgi:hypothetical protein
VPLKELFFLLGFAEFLSPKKLRANHRLKSETTASATVPDLKTIAINLTILIVKICGLCHIKLICHLQIDEIRDAVWVLKLLPAEIRAFL